MLSNFLIIIILIVGMGIIYKKYYENTNVNKNENTNVNKNENTNTNLNIENYKPFSISESKGTKIDTNEISVKTPYTREKTTTGLLNII